MFNILGDVDELSCSIGLSRVIISTILNSPSQNVQTTHSNSEISDQLQILDDQLNTVQCWLQDIGTSVAVPLDSLKFIA